MPGHTTKFGVGDVVWLLHANRAMSGIIKGVHLDIVQEHFQKEKTETYDLDGVSVPGDERETETSRGADLLYTSREALLASL